MIINDFITIAALSFMLQNAPYNPSYDYGAKIQYQETLSPLIFKDTGNSAYYIETYFSLTANMSYNTTSSSFDYYIDSFQFTITPKLYFVNNFGSVEMEHQLNYIYKPSYVVRPGRSSDLSRFSFVYGVNTDDEMYLNVFDDVNRVVHLSYNADESFPLDSNATYRIDSSFFVSTVQDWLQDFGDSYGSGYTQGHAEGLEEGIQSVQLMDPQMFTIFNGILNVAMIPINVFLGIFNWEVFGINIASLVSSLLSIAILVIVIRLIAGSSAKGD